MSITFLSELYSPYADVDGLLCEVRTLAPGRAPDTAAPTPRYFGLARLDKVTEYARSHRDAFDVYMGVLPRDRRADSGLGGLDCHCPVSAWLWCDVDRGDATNAEVVDFLRHVRSRLPAPRLLVFSGSGGVHLYYRLATPSGDVSGVSSLMRRLCAAIGHGTSGIHADKSCCNPSRILRLPRTFNHKHAPPRPVEWGLCDEYDALDTDQWDALLPFDPLPARDRRVSPKMTAAGVCRDPKFNTVPPKLREWAETGYPEGNRHHDLVGAAAWLRRDTDLPETVAYELFLTKAQNSFGRRQITEAEVEKAWGWAG